MLKKASQQNASAPTGAQRAVIINMSSVLGSIGQNNQGGFYPYRASKVSRLPRQLPRSQMTCRSRPLLRHSDDWRRSKQPHPAVANLFVILRYLAISW